MDVDFVLDAAKLKDGRYAELLELLLQTNRYVKGEKPFQLVVSVDLEDGDEPVQVELEFLASKEVRLQKRKTKLVPGFRVLQIDGAEVAFRDPVEYVLSGKNVRGANNTVALRVAALSDFLLMKAHAIGKRDKPKDTYDFCYCLDHCPNGIESLAGEWKDRVGDPYVAGAIRILREKFSTVKAFGPQQLVEFHNALTLDVRAMHARRAFELIQQFLKVLS